LGLTEKEITGDWRRLHSEELCNLYSSSAIRVISSKRIRWAEHMHKHTWLWHKKLKERDGLEDLGSKLTHCRKAGLCSYSVQTFE
jgi:hypothetical protein